MLIYPTHADGRRDQRYHANTEYCGYSIPLIVVRFCDKWIGAVSSEELANRVMAAHAATREKLLIAA